MWRQLLVIFYFTGMPFFAVFGQSKEYFSVKNNDRYDKIKLTLAATSGVCYVKPSSYFDAIRIFGSDKNLENSPLFKTEIIRRTKMVDFSVETTQGAAMGKALSSRIFGDNICRKNKWNVLLSDDKPLDLNLNYVVGEANVDLSGLPIENLKIKSGNADVRIDYLSGKYSPLEMDTMRVEVDMGSLAINRVNLGRAKQVEAKVGFGKLRLDFGSHPARCSSNISASVDAGSMEIAFPDNTSPAIIRINNSPLCHIKLPQSFRKIGNNIYANHAYAPDCENLVTFDLNVSLGYISFVDAE